MGACCRKSEDHGTVNSKFQNLAQQGIPQDDLTVRAVIKAQAMFRGILTRREIKRVYGYTFHKEGLMDRRAIYDDPDLRRTAKKRVNDIRMKLGSFKENISTPFESGEFNV